MARPNASDQELWDVLEKVNLSEFLKEQDGLNTKVLEKGSNFSGGQCQRLAFARALLHDSKIYIFDEATSNIDVESEEILLSQLKKLISHKTVILISHRLANIVDADQILVLQDGKVVEKGTHETLKQNKGHYAKLWEQQYQLEQFKWEETV